MGRWMGRPGLGWAAAGGFDGVVGVVGGGGGAGGFLWIRPPLLDPRFSPSSRPAARSDRRGRGVCAAMLGAGSRLRLAVRVMRASKRECV